MTELWKLQRKNDAYFTHGIGNLRDRWYLPHCSENELVECKAEEAVEVRANSSVLDVVCIPSIQRCTVGHIGSSEATPGRPTVSAPAALTPIGYLQFENGTLLAEHSTEFSNRFGVSQVTKLAVHPRLELLLESEPLAISQSEDQTAVHEGEVFAGVQSVLFSGTASRPTVSVSYIRRVHVSVAPELDIGSFRQLGLFLLSDDIHGFHVDMNGIVAEQAQDGVRRAQFG